MQAKPAMSYYFPYLIPERAVFCAHKIRATALFLYKKLNFTLITQKLIDKISD